MNNWIEENKEEIWLIVAGIIGSVFLFSVLNYSFNKMEKQQKEVNQQIQECFSKADDLDWCLNNFNE